MSGGARKAENRLNLRKILTEYLEEQVRGRDAGEWYIIGEMEG